MVEYGHKIEEKVKAMQSEIKKNSPDWCGPVDWVPACKPLVVRFPVRAHAWVVGQVPSGEYVRDNNTLMFLSLPPPLSKNK